MPWGLPSPLVYEGTQSCPHSFAGNIGSPVWLEITPVILVMIQVLWMHNLGLFLQDSVLSGLLRWYSIYRVSSYI